MRTSKWIYKVNYDFTIFVHWQFRAACLYSKIPPPKKQNQKQKQKEKKNKKTK